MAEIKTVEDLIKEIETQEDGIVKDGKGTNPDNKEEGK